MRAITSKTTVSKFAATSSTGSWTLAWPSKKGNKASDESIATLIVIAALIVITYKSLAHEIMQNVRCT